MGATKGAHPHPQDARSLRARSLPITRNNADSEKRLHSDPQAGLHLNFLERCISRVILRSV